MAGWLGNMRFLWKEDPPPEEAPRADCRESAGIPGPLRRATRFALTGLIAVNLMAQVIGVRLVAPVDAAPKYRCKAQCQEKRDKCLAKANTKAKEKACKRQFDDCKDDCKDKDKDKDDD